MRELTKKVRFKFMHKENGQGRGNGGSHGYSCKLVVYGFV